MIAQKNGYKYLPSTEHLSYTIINYLFLAFILFENLFKPRQSCLTEAMITDFVSSIHNLKTLF